MCVWLSLTGDSSWQSCDAAPQLGSRFMWFSAQLASAVGVARRSYLIQRWHVRCLRRARHVTLFMLLGSLSSAAGGCFVPGVILGRSSPLLAKMKEIACVIPAITSENKAERSCEVAWSGSWAAIIAEVWADCVVPSLCLSKCEHSERLLTHETWLFFALCLGTIALPHWSAFTGVALFRAWACWRMLMCK